MTLFWLNKCQDSLERSEIREIHVPPDTLLVGAHFAGVPGLRASHFIQATFDTEISQPDGHVLSIQIRNQTSRFLNLMAVGAFILEDYSKV